MKPDNKKQDKMVKFAQEQLNKRRRKGLDYIITTTNQEHNDIHASAFEQVKQKGSSHYKTGDVEPIDLYRSLGILRPWAIGEICQHAIRNIEGEINQKDMDKIIHYAEILKATGCHEIPF